MEIRAVTLIRTNFEPIQTRAKKKVLKNETQAAIYLWRAVRKRIRRAGAKSQVKNIDYSLWHWAGDRLEKLDISPEEFMRGKRSVAPGKGRGGKQRVEVQNAGTFRWNKVSKPGQGPISHPANAPGWQDEWLRNSIVWHVEGPRIYIVSNPAPPGKRMSKSGAAGRMYPETLEHGGALNWRRRIPDGYVVETVKKGYTANEGNGRYILGKKQNDGQKIWRPELGKNGRFVNRSNRVNKSGRSRRTHEVKFREPHVALRRHYMTWTGQKTIEPRPFMAPVQELFFREYFPQLFAGIIEEG